MRLPSGHGIIGAPPRFSESPQCLPKLTRPLYALSEPHMKQTAAAHRQSPSPSKGACTDKVILEDVDRFCKNENKGRYGRSFSRGCQSGFGCAQHVAPCPPLFGSLFWRKNRLQYQNCRFPAVPKLPSPNPQPLPLSVTHMMQKFPSLDKTSAMFCHASKR